MKILVGPLTWAYVIIVGGLMITPEGIIPIVTNPAAHVIVGLIGVVLGALGFISIIKKPAAAGRSNK